MTVTADVVVAGAGHNSLITAAYLAKSGREVVVLDALAIPGGGAVSEELLLPGYNIDTCSTGHTLLLNNPLITRDELGLISEQGLEYIDPDPVGHVAFPDGEQFTVWLDLDRTLTEVERYSKPDVDAYRRLIRDWDEVKDAFARNTFSPVGWGPPLDQMLSELPRGKVWLRIKALSAWEVIQREFESRHVQAAVFWQAFQTFVSLDLPGSGTLAYSILAGRQKRSWSIPVGGSGRLTEALVRVIEAHGGTILCNRKVNRLILENGRCVGVETESGEPFIGRQAVVSTIHVKHLIDMAPADAWDEAFRYGVETLNLGMSCFVVYLATTDPPRFAGARGPGTAVSAGLAGWPEDTVAATRAVREGRPVEGFPWLLVGTPTLVDPQRAPHGNHTVKIIALASPEPPPGAASWDEGKEAHADGVVEALRKATPNLTDDVILARLVRSPVDVERANPHMINGTMHGGDRGHAYSGPLRPAPGWAQHRMPIPGLYQTGGTTHPGGSITGAPGRNAAEVILHDLGTSIDEVIGRS